MYTMSPNLHRAILHNIRRRRQSKASPPVNNDPEAADGAAPPGGENPPSCGQIMEFFGSGGEWKQVGEAGAADASAHMEQAEKMLRLASSVVELHQGQAAPPTQEQVDALILGLL